MDSLTIRRKAPPAMYALHRQMVAVDRCLAAATPEESLKARRWACAWQQLLQRKLELWRVAPAYLH